MLPTQQSSLRLFRFRGIDVYVHWAWVFVAIIQIQDRANAYSSFAWNVAEYLTLFLIVLLHEFGHALACRQVGGSADQIMLWPLGGVAYVAPPPRPGANLWSIAAGPLVNVALVFVFYFVGVVAHQAGWRYSMPDLWHFIRNVTFINLGLLIFNILPIYPLDGGQILRSLLWFVIGRARSLFVAVIIGFIGVAGLAILAIYEMSFWTGLVTYWVFLRCLNGWKQAQALRSLEMLPRRPGLACPSCGDSPHVGALWKCRQCGMVFDTFETGASCPGCHTQFPVTQCLNCGTAHPMAEWRRS